MRRDEPEGNALVGLVYGALLSAPVWLAVWALFRWLSD